MKKITKELPSLRKSVRIIGDLISDEKYDLPLAVMNELLDYKDTLEDFDLAISELKEDLIDSGAYNEDYIEKTKMNVEYLESINEFVQIASCESENLGAHNVVSSLHDEFAKETNSINKKTK